MLLVLIQVGGLGVMTYTSLIFLLWRKQVPFTSREAVSQALLVSYTHLDVYKRQQEDRQAGRWLSRCKRVGMRSWQIRFSLS